MQKIPTYVIIFSLLWWNRLNRQPPALFQKVCRWLCMREIFHWKEYQWMDSNMTFALSQSSFAAILVLISINRVYHRHSVKFCFFLLIKSPFFYHIPVNIIVNNNQSSNVSIIESNCRKYHLIQRMFQMVQILRKINNLKKKRSKPLL